MGKLAPKNRLAPHPRPKPTALAQHNTPAMTPPSPPAPAPAPYRPTELKKIRPARKVGTVRVVTKRRKVGKSRQLKLLPGVGAKKHATVEVRALALANHAKGMAVREVAEVAKVSERTMYYWLATWSAPFPL